MVTYHFLHEQQHWSLPGEESFDGRIQTETRYQKMRRQRESDQEEINHLWTQLSIAPRDIKNPTIAVVSKFSRLLVARHHEDGRIVGMATLCIVSTLHGSIGFVEDVIVEELMRGERIGEGLMIRLIEYARNTAELDQLVLTSRPERIAANKLYQKLGFKQYEPTPTNHYRLTL
jgi:ribosomal protein S18 acetylase RimI-like enzyme